MRRVIFLSILATVLSMALSQKASASQSVEKQTIRISVPTAKPLTAQYFWILLGDGCFHLARLNEPGYTDSQGIYHAGWSVTFMGYDNYIGTTVQCPPSGTAFC